MHYTAVPQWSEVSVRQAFHVRPREFTRVRIGSAYLLAHFVHLFLQTFGKKNKKTDHFMDYVSGGDHPSLGKAALFCGVCNYERERKQFSASH